MQFTSSEKWQESIIDLKHYTPHLNKDNLNQKNTHNQNEENDAANKESYSPLIKEMGILIGDYEVPNFCMSSNKSKIDDSPIYANNNFEKNTKEKKQILIEKMIEIEDPNLSINLNKDKDSLISRLENLEEKIVNLKQQNNEQVKEIHFLKNENLSLKDELYKSSFQNRHHTDKLQRLYNEQTPLENVQRKYSKYSSIKEISEYSMSNSPNSNLKDVNGYDFTTHPFIYDQISEY